MDSDEELLAAVGRSEQWALGVLYERHATALLRLIRRMISDAGRSEEVLQETWLAVWRSASGFRGESAARAWLFGVAKRQASTHLRRRAPATVELDETEVGLDTADVESAVLARAAHEELAAGVRALPEHLRDVVLLVLVDDLPYPEVATALDIPVGTVKSRMSHARRRLAAALSPEPTTSAVPVGKGDLT